MVDALEKHQGPAYVRINRNDLDFTYPQGEPYHIGKVSVVKEGSEAVVFACGVMVSLAVKAGRALGGDRVVGAGGQREHDQGRSTARRSSGSRPATQAIVVAEEHSIVGGLGSAVLEALRRERHAPVEFVGINDSFGLSAADYPSLLEHYGLTSGAIESAIKDIIIGEKRK